MTRYYWYCITAIWTAATPMVRRRGHFVLDIIRTISKQRKCIKLNVSLSFTGNVM